MNPDNPDDFPPIDVSILREEAPVDAEEAEWLKAASLRMRAHFRERLFGAYAQFEDDEETGSRPSWPGRG